MSDLLTFLFCVGVCWRVLAAPFSFRPRTWRHAVVVLRSDTSFIFIHFFERSALFPQTMQSTKSISLRFFRCSHFHGVQYRESFRLCCAMRNNDIQALVRTCTFSHQINLRCHTLWLVTLASCPWKTLCLCLCAHRFTAQDALLVEMLDFD